MTDGGAGNGETMFRRVQGILPARSLQKQR